MALSESQWEWWNEQSLPKTKSKTPCQRCGVYAEKVGGLTRHHEKNGKGNRTGRVTKLCRMCHSQVHNMEPKYISVNARERAFDHVSGCEDCADKILKVIDHALDKKNDCMIFGDKSE